MNHFEIKILHAGIVYDVAIKVMSIICYLTWQVKNQPILGDRRFIRIMNEWKKETYGQSMCDSMEENTYKEDYILFDKTAKKKKIESSTFKSEQ